MTIGSLPRVLAGLMALAGFFFALGVTAAFTPRTVDLVLLGTGALVSLAASVYAFRRFRVWPFLAPPLVLFIAVAAASVGNYLPYELGIGDLSAAEYGSDDRPGKHALSFNLIIMGFMAVLVGLVVSILSFGSLLIARWLSPRSGASPAGTPGTGLQHDH